MPETTTNPNHHPRYWALRDLCAKLPGKVPLLADPDNRTKDIKLTGARRMVLWTLAAHADGNDETYVSRETIADEVQCDVQTVDRSTPKLKAAGLIKSYQRISADGRFRSDLWWIDRARIESLVPQSILDERLGKTLAAVKQDGKCLLRIDAASLRRTKSRLCHLAGDFRLRFTDDAMEGVKMCDLTIRAEQMMEADTVTGATIAAMKLSATPAPAQPSGHAAVTAALLSCTTLGGKLVPSDADSIAAALVEKHGLEAVLTAVGGLSEAAITGAAKVENTAGYLRKCLSALLTNVKLAAPVKAQEQEPVVTPAPAPVTVPAPVAPLKPVAAPAPEPVAAPAPVQRGEMTEDECRRLTIIMRECQGLPMSSNVDLTAKANAILASPHNTHPFSRCMTASRYVFFGPGRDTAWFGLLREADNPALVLIENFFEIEAVMKAEREAVAA